MRLLDAGAAPPGARYIWLDFCDDEMCECVMAIVTEVLPEGRSWQVALGEGGHYVGDPLEDWLKLYDEVLELARHHEAAVSESAWATLCMMTQAAACAG